MKRVLILLTVMLFILSSVTQAGAYQVTAYAVYEDHTRIVSDNGIVYLLSYSGSSLSVDRIVPDGDGVNLSFAYPIHSAGVFGGTVVALYNDHENDQLIVSTYDIGRDVLESFVINHTFARDNCDFYYDGGLYLTDYDDPCALNRYSASGKMIGSYSFNNTITGLLNRDGVLYAVSNHRLYRVSDRLHEVAGESVYSPLSFIDTGMLCDRSGSIYTLSGDRLRLYCTLNSGSECTAAFIDGEFYYPSGRTVYRYDDDGHAAAALTLDSDIIALYGYDNVLYAVDAGYCVYRILLSEFIALKSNSDTSSITQEQSSPKYSGGRISSDVYTVDYDAMRILGIPGGTTFARFKQNMRYEGYSVRFFRDDEERKSGSVGTAMTAVFSDGEDSYTFELSVVGDITGEGNINTRDLTELMDYLVGSIRFDGVYLDAGDLSRDGVVDAVDMAILKRRIS